MACEIPLDSFWSQERINFGFNLVKERSRDSGKRFLATAILDFLKEFMDKDFSAYLKPVGWDQSFESAAENIQ